MAYTGPERRRWARQWREGNPRSLNMPAVIGMLVGVTASAADAVTPGDPFELLGQYGYTVGFSALAAKLLHWLGRIALDKIGARFERVNALPEKFEAMERSITSARAEISHAIADVGRTLSDQFAARAALMDERDETRQAEIEGIHRRLELLERRMS